MLQRIGFGLGLLGAVLSVIGWVAPAILPAL
jgi:hypothetical protein